MGDRTYLPYLDMQAYADVGLQTASPRQPDGEGLYFMVYRSRRTKQWRWRLRAGNHKNICHGAQGFTRRVDCLHSMKLVAAANEHTPIYQKDIEHADAPQA